MGMAILSAPIIGVPIVACPIMSMVNMGVFIMTMTKVSTPIIDTLIHSGCTQYGYTHIARCTHYGCVQ
jgi:hypothetical protein